MCIEGRIAKIRAKMFIQLLCNSIYDIRRCIFELQRFFTLIGGMVVKILAKTFLLLWNRLYYIRRSIFRTIEVILRWLEIQLPQYGDKRLFAGFEIGFTTIAVLFIEHWSFYLVDLRYCCQDTGKNFYSLICNWNYSIRRSIFWKLFCFNWRYWYQYTGKNIYSPALKLGLRHLPFYI